MTYMAEFMPINKETINIVVYVNFYSDSMLIKTHFYSCSDVSSGSKVVMYTAVCILGQLHNEPRKSN